jgi:hypothetical protein
MEKKIDFKEFYLSLSEAERVRFGDIAGVKPQYIRTHLIYGRKVPQPKTMDGLVLALFEFNAPITRQDLLHFFYPPMDGEQERRSGKDRRHDRRAS